MATYWPSEIDVIAIREGCCALEAEIHKALSDCRLKGEWFMFDDRCVEVFHSIEIPISKRPNAKCLSQGATMTLDQYIRDKGLTNAEFGELVGANHSTISRLRKGGQVPSPELMLAIFERTDGVVTANDFYGIKAA
jgi:DNA-binding XRE family transcriptional regulator